MTDTNKMGEEELREKLAEIIETSTLSGDAYIRLLQAQGRILQLISTYCEERERTAQQTTIEALYKNGKISAGDCVRYISEINRGESTINKGETNPLGDKV